jgi:hypothetical protein
MTASTASVAGKRIPAAARKTNTERLIEIELPHTLRHSQGDLFSLHALHVWPHHDRFRRLRRAGTQCVMAAPA